jgi:hypothetical protein
VAGLARQQQLLQLQQMCPGASLQRHSSRGVTVAAAAGCCWCPALSCTWHCAPHLQVNCLPQTKHVLWALNIGCITDAGTTSLNNFQ